MRDASSGQSWAASSSTIQPNALLWGVFDKFNWPGRETSISFSVISDLRSDGVSPHEFVGLNVVAPTVGVFVGFNVVAPTVGVFVVGLGEEMEGLYVVGSGLDIMEGLYVVIAEMATGFGVSTGVGIGGMIGTGKLPLSKMRVQNSISSSSIMPPPLRLPFGSIANIGFLLTTILLVRNPPKPPSTCRPFFAETGTTPDERKLPATTKIRLN